MKNEDREQRLTRWTLQSAARQLLPAERIAWCMRRLQDGRSVVNVLQHQNVKAASYGGLMVCGSVWNCHACASKITERRREEIRTAIETNAERFTPRLATFTLQHSCTDRLETLLDDLLDAYRKLKAGRRWIAFEKDNGIVASIRAVEVTHGQNGWHPHLHTLFFFEKNHHQNWGTVTDDLKHYWLDMLESNDRWASYARGADLREADWTIAEYLEKFGKLREKLHWGADRELTKASVKLGKIGGRTPTQILADWTTCPDDDKHAEEKRRDKNLFQEYAKAFKGKQQIRWSNHAREILGLAPDEETDEELAERIEEPALLLAQLNLSDWKTILHNDARGEVLEIAATGTAEDVKAYIDQLPHRGRCYIL